MQTMIVPTNCLMSDL